MLGALALLISLLTSRRKFLNLAVAGRDAALGSGDALADAALGCGRCAQSLSGFGKRRTELVVGATNVLVRRFKLVDDRGSLAGECFVVSGERCQLLSRLILG